MEGYKIVIDDPTLAKLMEFVTDNIKFADARRRILHRAAALADIYWQTHDQRMPQITIEKSQVPLDAPASISNLAPSVEKAQ